MKSFVPTHIVEKPSPAGGAVLASGKRLSPTEPIGETGWFCVAKRG